MRPEVAHLLDKARSDTEREQMGAVPALLAAAIDLDPGDTETIREAASIMDRSGNLLRGLDIQLPEGPPAASRQHGDETDGESRTEAADDTGLEARRSRERPPKRRKPTSRRGWALPLYLTIATLIGTAVLAPERVENLIRHGHPLTIPERVDRALAGDDLARAAELLRSGLSDLTEPDAALGAAWARVALRAPGGVEAASDRLLASGDTGWAGHASVGLALIGEDDPRSRRHFSAAYYQGAPSQYVLWLLARFEEAGGDPADFLPPR